MLKENILVTIQPITLKIGELLLKQDEQLLILSVTNNQVTFKRLSTDTVHTTSKMAIEFSI